MAGFGFGRRAKRSGGIAGSAGGIMTISTAPTITGDAVVGQTLYATNGTYNVTPDSYTRQWYKDAVAISGETDDNYLIVDADVASVFTYKEIAVKSGWTSPAENPSANTSAVADIDLTDAITAFTRTSSSGVTPMLFEIDFDSNVYTGYFLRARVYSDSGLSTLLQDITHELTGADIAGGALNLASDGLTAIGATDWLQLQVYTTSPNGNFHSYTDPTPISPTDATGFRYAKFTTTAVNGGADLVLRELEMAETVSGTNIASGKSYTYLAAENPSGSFASSRICDNSMGTLGAIEGMPATLIIDFGVAVDPHELRLYSFSGFYSSAPNTFTLHLSTDGVTWGSPVVSASGVTWADDLPKTYSW